MAAPTVTPKLDATKVRVGVSGRLAYGPTSTSAPTAVDSAVSGVKEVGYISEDGVTEKRDRSTTKLKAWQNAATVRTIVEEASFQIEATIIETSKETLELFYGAPVGTKGDVLVNPSATGGTKAIILDVIDGDDMIRTWIPNGEVIEVGEMTYKNGEPIGYPVTIEAYPTAIDGVQAAAKKFYKSQATG